MAKTRSQTGELGVKKEEQEDRKPNLCLNGVNSTTRNRIAKRKSPRNRSRRSPVQQIKVEVDTDTKSLLQSSPEIPKRQRVSQEQINRLIDAVVNHNMSIRKAACAVKLSASTASYYYNVYKNDPEKKMPLPKYQFMHYQRTYTQQDIKNLIAYIEDDKLSMLEASAKVNMNISSSFRYYNRYLQDPEYNIPIPRPHQTYTQDQKDKFIGYVVNDKMNISEASKKAKMPYDTGKRYYLKYFDEQNPGIAIPSHIAIPRRRTQGEIKELISYIVDDKMTKAAASRKANISESSVTYHYQKYLRGNNMEIPVSKTRKRYTQDEIDEFISCIADDKMSMRAASKKTNIGSATGWKYYQRYLKEHNIDPPISRWITQDKIKELISYIVDDKMSITAASKKAMIPYSTGYAHYQRYLKSRKHDAPTRYRSVLKNNQ